MGTLTIPTTASTALARSARWVSSNEARSPMYPRYKNRSSSSEVRRGVQTHQVPHMGFPNNDPVASAAAVKEAPIGAQAAATAWATLMRQISPTAAAIPIQV